MSEYPRLVNLEEKEIDQNEHPIIIFFDLNEVPHALLLALEAYDSLKKHQDFSAMVRAILAENFQNESGTVRYARLRLNKKT